MKEIKYQFWHKAWERFMTNDEVNGYQAMWMDGILVFPTNIVPRQSTGLKDKNGKEIYEGDVVRHDDEPVEINSIDFYDAQYHLEPHGLRLCDEYEKIRIIGNIYENPKLIKEE